MRGPVVAKVSLRRKASKMASRVFSSAQTPVRPDADQRENQCFAFCAVWLSG